MSADFNRQTLKLCFELAEHSYSQALGNGVKDPVVVLQKKGDFDPDRGTPVDVSWGTREDVIEWLNESCPDAAELVANPDRSRPMTIVVADEGLSVYDCTPFA